jgi:hypothetical protein
MNSIKNRWLGAGIAALTITAALAAPVAAQTRNRGDRGQSNQSTWSQRDTTTRHDGHRDGRQDAVTHRNRTDWQSNWQSNSNSHRYYRSSNRDHNWDRRYTVHHDNGLHKGWSKGKGNQKHHHNHDR